MQKMWKIICNQKGSAVIEVTLLISILLLVIMGTVFAYLRLYDEAILRAAVLQETEVEETELLISEGGMLKFSQEESNVQVTLTGVRTMLSRQYSYTHSILRRDDAWCRRLRRWKYIGANH